VLKKLLAVLVDGVPPPQRRFVAPISDAAHTFATRFTTRFSSIREGGREGEEESEVVSLLPKQGWLSALASLVY
jgi:hypothetical protein